MKQILGESLWRGDREQFWSYDMGFGGGIGFLFHRLDVVQGVYFE